VNLLVLVKTSSGLPSESVIDAPEVVIGRAVNPGLVIADPSVSRQHARLVRRDGRWWIEALSATNPTFVNKIAIQAPKEWVVGDIVGMGQATLRILGAPQHSEPTPAMPIPIPAEGRQAARLRTLNEVHRALATAISLTALLDLILERCFQVLRPEEGVILLRNATGDLVPAASRQGEVVGANVSVSRRILDEVTGKGKSTLIVDAAIDDRFSGSESIIFSGVRSVLAAPMTDADGIIGMIALSSRAAVRQFSQQDLEMLESLASAASLRVRNVALAEEAAERKVLERELALAHDMQMSMLPRCFPDRQEIDLAASLTPARSVGGDLYDFVVAGDRLWFIVGDVSGKGVAASLYMAVTKTLFRAMVQIEGIDLAGVLGRMNRELCRDNDQMLFVTALVGHLALLTGEVTLGDAGHNPAVLISPAGTLSQPRVPKSIAFGVLEDAVYTEGRFTLERDATLLLYTDGATDARNPAGDIFGDAALEDAIATASKRTAAALVNAVIERVEAFSAGAPPEDDLTLLAIRYRG
jgi:serine phosphatase RsbU (regulator of sigma subunit)/pSer/pThr/pTyr-binding forkhead associated (FHA) protein